MSSEIWVNRRQEVQKLKSLQSRCRDYKKMSKENCRKAVAIQIESRYEKKRESIPSGRFSDGVFEKRKISY